MPQTDSTLHRWSSAIRQHLLPDAPRDHHKGAFFWLVYLGFLFMPATIGWKPERLLPSLGWLLPTLLSLPVFLYFYLRGRRELCGASRAETLAIVLLGFVLMPWNPFANTYLIYACGFAPLFLPGFTRPMLFTLATLAVYDVETWLLDYSWEDIAITTLIAAGNCIGGVFIVETRRRNAALQLSHEEVRRLAATAERERISRDLHDLLGHTLSLIAVKMELADRLFERDPPAARRELQDTQKIARDALTQVRSAVTGIRATGLAAELAASRLLLESSQVSFSYRRDDDAILPPDLETALAMVLREAVTNIHRHAQARKASVSVDRDAQAVHILIRDDGRGGLQAEGNGLTGMRERIAALGGTMAIDSPRGGGTEIRIRVPFSASGSLAHRARGMGEGRSAA